MAAPAPNIQSILEALKGVSQQPSSAAPYQQPPPGTPAGIYTPSPNPYSAIPPPYNAPPAAYPPAAGYGYPAPSVSGSIDLSSIRPTNSGTVSFEQAVAQAKQFATSQGVMPYERSSGYMPPPDGRDHDGRVYRRSRSRSPRRDAYRENFNPYRDERRGDRKDGAYGRDQSFSPGPRGRPGFSPKGGNGHRERSPMPRKDENNEMMEIEGNLVGLIIGRGGENLRRIEKDSNCRIQFIPAATQNETLRQCRITGPPARRAEARGAIDKIIQDSGLSTMDRGGSGAPRDGGRGHPSANVPVIPKDGEEHVQIMVPDRTVGLIIGRGGETIRDLQERSRCHINIVGENKSVQGLRPVNLIGVPEATRRAKDFIMEIVDSDSRNAGGQGTGQGQPTNVRPQRDHGRGGPHGGGGADRINDSIYVPSEAVGMIIGRGGETIREMQNMTGCKINVSQSSGPAEVEREIGLVGTHDAIERAKQAIEDKVEAVRNKNGPGTGGGNRGRSQHGDFDNPNYGQPSNNHRAASAAQGPPPVTVADPSAGADGAADPYAIYGGYRAYLAMWYQAVAAQQQGQGHGDTGPPPPPPGTS